MWTWSESLTASADTQQEISTSEQIGTSSRANPGRHDFSRLIHKDTIQTINDFKYQ